MPGFLSLDQSHMSCWKCVLGVNVRIFSVPVGCRWSHVQDCAILPSPSQESPAQWTGRNQEIGSLSRSPDSHMTSHDTQHGDIHVAKPGYVMRLLYFQFKQKKWQEANKKVNTNTRVNKGVNNNSKQTSHSLMRTGYSNSLLKWISNHRKQKYKLFVSLLSAADKWLHLVNRIFIASKSIA